MTGVAQVLNSCGREQEDRGGHLGGVGLREPGRRGEKSGRPSLPQPDPATEGTSRFFKPTLHSGDRNVASCSFPGWRWKTLVTFRRARRFLPAPFSLTECEGSDRGWAPGPDPARRERRTGRGPRPPVLAEMERHRCHAGRARGDASGTWPRTRSRANPLRARPASHPSPWTPCGKARPAADPAPPPVSLASALPARRLHSGFSASFSAIAVLLTLVEKLRGSRLPLSSDPQPPGPLSPRMALVGRPFFLEVRKAQGLYEMSQ